MKNKNLIIKLAILANLLIAQFSHTGINDLDENGETPLIKAIYQQDLAETKNLLALGADPYVSKKDGANAFDFALWGNNAEIKKLVLNWQDPETGETLLMKKIFQQDVPKIEQLLENGADPLLAKKDGASAIDFAIWGPNQSIGNMVINHQNEMGETALIKAVYEQNIDLVKKLLENGAKVYLTKKDGSSAFDFALWNQNTLLSKILHEALENTRQEFLKTPVHLEYARKPYDFSAPAICINTNLTTLAEGTLPKTSSVADYNFSPRSPILVVKLDDAFMARVPNSIKHELTIRNIPFESVDLFWNVQHKGGLGTHELDRGSTRLKAHGWAAPDAPLVYEGDLVNREFLMGIYEPENPQISFDLEVGKLKHYPVQVHDLGMGVGTGISPPEMARVRISQEDQESTAFWSLVIDDQNPRGPLKANVTLHWLLSTKPSGDSPATKLQNLLYKSFEKRILGVFTLGDVLDKLRLDPYFSKTKMVIELLEFFK